MEKIIYNQQLVDKKLRESSTRKRKASRRVDVEY
jgi:hypothetical protein